MQACIPENRGSKDMRSWILIFLLATMASAAEYRAGLARIDITPPIGHQMGGYAARKHGSTGLHDPLYATVLVIEEGDNSVALVTCDLRSFVSTRVGELAKQKFGIKNTLIDVSHTHSGPLTWELRSSWYAEAEDKMVEAIGRAKASMFPASLQISTGHIYLGFNRRKIIDGKGYMWWRNAEELPSHPVDPTVNILQVKDNGGRIRGVLVNYACHPSVLGPQNYNYSADYPGAMKRYVESKIPGATALFIQGGAGDINPYHDKEPVATQFQTVEDMGQTLGKYVVANLDNKPTPITGPLLTTSEVMQVRNRWKSNEQIPIGWTAGEFGHSFCFAAFPGEPFVELQLSFRHKSECDNAMLFGYSYSVGGAWAGYIPTILASVQGGYGADYNTTVQPGTGEQLVDRAVIKLFQLRGLLHDVPDPRF
jgi:Neutral/alkaline non-lysosomal ceramidase, N-terminal